jgi:hypothetical protein
MGRTHDLAATAGAWNVRHRRTAILGWPVFVVAAYLLGSVIGQHSLTDAQMGNGQSRLGTSAFERAFPYYST